MESISVNPDSLIAVEHISTSTVPPIDPETHEVNSPVQGPQVVMVFFGRTASSGYSFPMVLPLDQAAACAAILERMATRNGWHHEFTELKDNKVKALEAEEKELGI